MFSLKSGIKCSENKLKHLETFLSSENTKMNLTSELRRIGIIFSKLIFLTSKKSVFFRLYYENIFDVILFLQASSSLP
jgi:microcystin degradation protein MlrC